MMAVIIIGPIDATADAGDPIFFNELVNSISPVKQL